MEKEISKDYVRTVSLDGEIELEVTTATTGAVVATSGEVATTVVVS